MHKTVSLHRLFEYGIVLKGLHALLELATAAVIYFWGFQALDIVSRISGGELSEDPSDALANFFVLQANHIFSSAHAFAAAYLLVSATINLLIVGGLYMNWQRAYPVSIGILTVFVLYQLVRLSMTHSVWLFLFMLFDVTVIWLVYQEYRRQSHSRAERRDALTSAQ